MNILSSHHSHLQARDPYFRTQTRKGKKKKKWGTALLKCLNNCTMLLKCIMCNIKSDWQIQHSANDVLDDLTSFLHNCPPLLGEGSGTPLQYSCLENPVDGGAWWAAVHEVAKSRTWLSDFTFTFHFHALEKEMATHSSVLAWRIPGTGEPGGLPSMGSRRVGHDWSDLAVLLSYH